MIPVSSRAPRYVAAFDSNWLLLTALARHLHGKEAPMLRTGMLVKAASTIVNAFPSGFRQTLYRTSGWWDAVPPASLPRIDSGEMTKWVASLYPNGRYEAVMVGATNGAAVHLCAALGIPWLPQTLLTTVRQPRIAAG